MYAGSQFDGGGALFSGGGFMPSQATQTPESSLSKSHGTQALLPLTVKQICEACLSNDDNSNFLVDGVEANNVKLLGRVTNMAERVTEVSFTLDDGTGRVEAKRWVNETSDSNEMAAIQNGMYVSINGSLKGFLGKKHVVAFSVRPVTDLNDVIYHFIECIHVHLENTRVKVGGPVPPQGNSVMGTPVRSEVKGFQNPISNQAQFSTHPGMGGYENDVNKMVLDVFQEPASLAKEHGLHVDDIVRRLGVPKAKIMDAIGYHVDVGNIYSTIDDDHYKSACNG